MNASLLSGNNKEAVGSLFYTGFYRKKKEAVRLLFFVPQNAAYKFLFYF